jgi:predicted PurR-regulated permease PerM
MTTQRQVLFWIIAVGIFVFALWFLQEILVPFLAGFVLAYFLDPLADWLERRGLPRAIAALLIIVTAVSALVSAALMIAPLLFDEIQKLSSSLPSLVNTLSTRLNNLLPPAVKDMISQGGSELPASASEIAGKATGWIATVLASVWTGGMAIVNMLSLLVLTPIVAFYLLKDWDRIVTTVDGWMPRDHAPEIRAIARDIDTAMAGFIRGQASVCLLLGAFYAICLTMAGLNFGFAVGFLSGALSFIPFVGAIVGGVLAIGIALAQFWPDFIQIALIVAIFAAGQFIEGNILSPKLVGGSIGLHPVWLMFALFAFGYMFGFTGLLLAVPLAAAAGVVVRYFLGQYLRSKLYRGTNLTRLEVPKDGPLSEG